MLQNKKFSFFISKQLFFLKFSSVWTFILFNLFKSSKIIQKFHFGFSVAFCSTANEFIFGFFFLFTFQFTKKGKKNGSFLVDLKHFFFLFLNFGTASRPKNLVFVEAVIYNGEISKEWTNRHIQGAAYQMKKPCAIGNRCGSPYWVWRHSSIYYRQLFTRRNTIVGPFDTMFETFPHQ